MLRAALATLALLLSVLTSAPSAREETPPYVSPEHEAGRKAIAAKNWTAALKALTAAEQKEPQSADIQNLLGFANRNAGNLDRAFQHYERALKINPRHLGAHEYVGEAYLLTNNLAKAEVHLAELRRHCQRVCEERDDLEKAIAAYKSKTAKK